MEKFYQNTLSFIRKYPVLEKTIVFITKYFPIIPFGLYPCILVYLFITKNTLLFETIWKPLLAFLIVSVFRKLVNRPRPYETMDIVSLVGHKQGESFPSRHAVSAMIISLVCFNVNMYLGIFSIMIALLICASRILAGVHYISDVFVSIVLAILIYFI